MLSKSSVNKKSQTNVQNSKTKSRLVWNRKCPKCRKLAIPQANYPTYFYCFKGGHGMFKILKIKGKTKALFEYDRPRVSF